MNTVIEQNLRSHADKSVNSLVNGAAANDDHLPGSGLTQAVQTPALTTGGWDAHDVWRRLIKEARDRREATGKLR
jgi:hypothetical protein